MRAFSPSPVAGEAARIGWRGGISLKAPCLLGAGFRNGICLEAPRLLGAGTGHTYRREGNDHGGCAGPGVTWAG